MTAREFEARVSALARRRGRAREAALLAGVCAFLAATTSFFMAAIELSLAAGATLGLVVGALNLLAYHETVAQMALDPSAYAIPEVSRYGSRFVTAAERARLASWLHDVLRESTMPECWCLADRVRRHARQLESLANELARPHVSIRPASAVACHRLLTYGAESPLYNPSIPSNELDAILLRIWHGLGHENTADLRTRE